MDKELSNKTPDRAVAPGINAAPASNAGWPWGANKPAPGRRAAVATTIAVLASIGFVVIHFPHLRVPDPTVRMHSDFSPIWYGAKLLAEGRNPYALIGPDMEIQSRWPALYPATAYVLALPLTLLREEVASVVFVFVSSFLLVFGATRHSWHLLPIFASVPFLNATILGQWSMLMTAVVFLPWLAFIACAKPQAGLPAVISSPRRTAIAVGGGILVLAVSLVILPSWPVEWLRLVSHSGQFRAPVMNLRGFGFVILLVLFRWRRPESWMVATMAVLPQAWFPYNWLLLLTLADTYREALVLTILMSVGGLAGEYVVFGMAALKAARVGGAFSAVYHRL
jgi:hypothetical protein